MLLRLTACVLLALPFAGCAGLPSLSTPPADTVSADGVPVWASVLVVINRAEVPVLDVYLSPCEDEAWGPDRLDADFGEGAQEVVMPSRSRSFALEPGCWDARTVFRDGREAEERGIEMTRNGQRTWTVVETEVASN